LEWKEDSRRFPATKRNGILLLETTVIPIQFVTKKSRSFVLVCGGFWYTSPFLSFLVLPLLLPDDGSSRRVFFAGDRNIGLAKADPCERWDLEQVFGFVGPHGTAESSTKQDCNVLSKPHISSHSSSGNGFNQTKRNSPSRNNSHSKIQVVTKIAGLSVLYRFSLPLPDGSLRAFLSGEESGLSCLATTTAMGLFRFFSFFCFFFLFVVVWEEGDEPAAAPAVVPTTGSGGIVFGVACAFVSLFGGGF
jgi:hypothetical protein